MTTAIIIQYVSNTQLEAVYHARAELSVLPSNAGTQSRRAGAAISRGGIAAIWFKLIAARDRAIGKLRELIENWTAAKNDKTIAWTLGIGWACNGGAMAGGSLVFAKAT